MLANRGEHSIEVGEIRDVTLDCDRAGAYFVNRCVELLAAAAADKDRRTLRNEPFRGRKSDPAVTAGDQRYFSFELAHLLTPFLGGYFLYRSVLNIGVDETSQGVYCTVRYEI
jgi:hypothetical protein